MLGLLCSTDLGIRLRALEVLRAVRKLHGALKAPAPQPVAGRRATLQSGGNANDAASGCESSSNSRRGTQHQQQQGFEGMPSTSGANDRLVFVADVIDRFGSILVARCYWDFGRWSDLWRLWRPLPDPLPQFEECAATARSADDSVRWARMVCELMKEIWRRCESSAWSGHLEIAAKLQALLSLDSNGRQVLPHDMKTELCRAHCLAVAAAPLLEASQVGRSWADLMLRSPDACAGLSVAAVACSLSWPASAYCPNKLAFLVHLCLQVGDKGLTSRDFTRLLVSSARSGIESQQQIAILGLGHISSACQAMAVQEAAALAEDYLDRQMQRV